LQYTISLNFRQYFLGTKKTEFTHATNQLTTAQQPERWSG
jgi:hypothetical protein